MTSKPVTSVVDPVQFNDACSQCRSSVDEYLSNAQRRYFNDINTTGIVCSDCLTEYADSPEIEALFDKIEQTLAWADQWKWETAAFEAKFLYAIRVERLRETGGWGAVVQDPVRPKLPDTSPPQNAAYQTALELVLDSWTDGQDEYSDRPVAVDLFSGAGGAALGMLDAGFSVTGVELDDDARTTHFINLDRILQKDLSVIDESLASNPDWLHASPPCQGYSRAGLQESDDERNQLTWDAVEWIKHLNPTVVTMEQVPGFQDGHHGERLNKELSKAGYTVSMDVLNAANYGVPQARNRLIVVAVEDTADASPSLPAPTHAPNAQQTLTGEKLETHRTVGDVLPLDSEKAEQSNHNPTSHTDRVTERFSRLDPGQNVTDLQNPGTKKASQRRLHPDETAPTITGVPSDYVHPTKDRCLTSRELARLQSFPDWFRFTGPEKGGGTTRGEITSQAEQIGNAVPPRFMKSIGEHINSLLEDTDN